jgi:hypothetical protein
VPQIEVQSSTFQRLQRLAEPFIDTPESVILRALDKLEGGTTSNPPALRNGKVDLVIDPRSIPNLTHTKLLSADLDGKDLSGTNWNSLLDEVLRVATRAGLKSSDIQRISGVNVKQGRKTDEGYGFLEDVDLSVQGQDANAACRGIFAIARHLKIGITIEFRWREKDGSAHPGKIAKISYFGP